jgi:hypothetical protein
VRQLLILRECYLSEFIGHMLAHTLANVSGPNGDMYHQKTRDQVVMLRRSGTFYLISFRVGSTAHSLVSMTSQNTQFVRIPAMQRLGKRSTSGSSDVTAIQQKFCRRLWAEASDGIYDFERLSTDFRIDNGCSRFYRHSSFLIGT